MSLSLPGTPFVLPVRGNFMYRIAAILLILPAFVPSLGWCDEAGRSAKAEEFIRLTKADVAVKGFIKSNADQLKSDLVRRMLGVEVPSELRQEVIIYQDKAGRSLDEQVSWEKVHPLLVRLIADTFTEAELDDIVAFYNSAGGRAMIGKNGAILDGSVKIVTRLAEGAKPAVDLLLEDFKSEVQRRKAERRSAK